VTIRNALFWDVMSFSSYKRTRLFVVANVVPSSPILVILKKEATRSSETSVLTRGTRGHIPEDGNLQHKKVIPVSGDWLSTKLLCPCPDVIPPVPKSRLLPIPRS
jgi:hypothetical protein